MSIDKRLISTGAGESPNWIGIAEYTGNTGTRTFSGLSNPPDFVMFMAQDNSMYHALVSRDHPEKICYTNFNFAVNYNGSTNAVNFTNDGFEIPTNIYTDNSQVGINLNGSNWIAISFYAADSYVSNTDGSITSQVKANPDMGFSIVKWTGNGDNQTVGHGLNSEPRLIVVQTTDQVNPDWKTSFRSNTPIGSNYWKSSNKTNFLDGGSYSTGGTTNGNQANSSTIIIGSDDEAGATVGETYMAYCWTDLTYAETKFFEYAGNSSTTQRDFSCGFDPRILFTYTNDTSYGAVMNYLNAYSSTSTEYKINSYARMGTSSGLSTITGEIEFSNNSNRVELRTLFAAYNKSSHNYLNLAFGSTYIEEMTVS
jgi:hypothetical protein